jgi:Predicted transcriptional regulator
MADKETIKDRIILFIDSQNIAFSAFEKQAGLSNGYIKRIKGAFGVDKIEDILKAFPSINKEWLLHGEGDMLLTSTKTDPPCYDDMSQYVTYRLPISAMAGTLANFTHSVYKNQLERIISPIKGVDYSMPVWGDSMEPNYPNGCEILLKKVNEKSFVKWGETYVLDTDNGAVIKNVFNGDDDNYVRCVSINNKYPDFNVPKKDIHGWYKILMVLTPTQN